MFSSNWKPFLYQECSTRLSRSRGQITAWMWLCTFFFSECSHNEISLITSSDLTRLRSAEVYTHVAPIQVAFGGDPEAALIQYTKNEEARRAISSTEAVLNNRFIRVYWHREPGTAGTQQQDQSSGSQAAISSASPGTQHSSAHMVGVEPKFRSPFLIDDIVSLRFGNTSFTLFPTFSCVCRGSGSTTQLPMC